MTNETKNALLEVSIILTFMFGVMAVLSTLLKPESARWGFWPTLGLGVLALSGCFWLVSRRVSLR